MPIPPIPPNAPLSRQKIQASAIRGVYNVTPANLQRLRGRLGQVLSGTGTTQFKVLIVGDSTTTGAGAGTGTAALTGASARKPANQLAAALTRRGIPNVCDMFYGDGGAGAAGNSMANYDPKLSLASPWQLFTNNIGFGYGMFYSNGGTTALTFTPTTAWDTAEIIYARNTSFGDATITLGGAAPTTGPTTLSGTGSITMVRATVTAASVGIRNIVLTAAGGNSCYVQGIRVWDSTKAQVQVASASNYGRFAADLASAAYPWEFRNMMTFYAADFTFINAALNDMNPGTAVSSYTASMQLIINAALSTGNCALVIPEFRNDSTAAQQSAITNAIYGLALSNGLPLIDISEAIGPYAGANTNGLYSDQIHLTSAGYAVVGELYARMIAEL